MVINDFRLRVLHFQLIIHLKASRFGWRAAAFAAEWPTAKPTNMDTGQSPIKSTCTICTPLSCHLLGLNHERLTYRYSGRDFRLTDVHGEVVKQILA